MYVNPVTQENIAKLKARGFTIIPPLTEGGFRLGGLWQITGTHPDYGCYPADTGGETAI